MKRREWKSLLPSFLLPAILMLTALVAMEIYPFGEKCFLPGDLYHQYMPFFSELIHKIRAGEGLGYSFHLGIGTNFLALFVYYLASPFHIFALFIPKTFLIEFITVMVVLKTGFCGLTFSVYLREHFQTKSISVVLFSCFYALSGYMAAYNYNIMWLDCVWLLPLIILGLERLVKEGKCGLYCVTLGLSIYTNYYLSIMICFFLVLYFVLLLVNNGGRRWKSVFDFTLFSLLAGGMAACLLIPEVCAIIQTDFGDMDFPNKVKTYFSTLDVLARHCMCVSTERGLEHWPNLYCGSAVLLFLPLYLINCRLSIRERFSKLALVGFFLLSFETNLLEFIWHGFNFPDSLPARQSFLYIFLVLLMCYEVYFKIQETDPQSIIRGYLAAVGFYLFCERFVQSEDFEPGVKLLTLMFVTLYAVLLYLYRTRNQRIVQIGIAVIAFVAVAAESETNLMNTISATTNRAAYLEPLADQKQLYEYAKEREDSFFRIEQFDRKTKNDSTLAGFPAASTFSSTMNSRVMDLYTRLGMRHSKVYYCFDGATPLTAALLNVNYMLGDSGEYGNQLYQLLEYSNQEYLYESRYTLPFGYVMPFGYDLPDKFHDQPLRLQNQMAVELGASEELFSKVEVQKVENDICMETQENGIYYAVVTATGTTRIDYIGGNEPERKFTDLKKGCVLYLGELEQGQKITLTNGDSKDDTPQIRADVYRLREEVLAELIDSLSRQRLENVTVSDHSLSGNIDMKEAGRLVLSIPAEDGWSIKINGEKTDSETFGNCLTAFDLEPGSYEIEMEYTPVGIRAGLAVSVSSIGIFIVLMVWRRRKQNEV